MSSCVVCSCKDSSKSHWWYLTTEHLFFLTKTLTHELLGGPVTPQGLLKVTTSQQTNADTKSIMLILFFNLVSTPSVHLSAEEVPHARFTCSASTLGNSTATRRYISVIVSIRLDVHLGEDKCLPAKPQQVRRMDVFFYVTENKAEKAKWWNKLGGIVAHEKCSFRACFP